MSASITEKVEEGGCENENVGYAPAHGPYRSKKGFASFETNPAKLQQFRMELKGVNAEDSKILRQKHTDMTAINARCEKENAKLTSKKTDLETANRGLTTEKDTLTEQLGVKNAQIDTLAFQNNGLAVDGNTCRETLVTEAAANTVLTSENTALETTNRGLTTEKKTLTETVDEKDVQIDTLASEIDDLKKRIPSERHLARLKNTAKLERNNELMNNLQAFHNESTEKMNNVVRQIKSLDNGDEITTVQETKLTKLKADLVVLLSVEGEQMTYDQAMAAWIERNEQPPNYPLYVNYGNDHEELDANVFIEHYLENGGENTLGDINRAKLADVKLISQQPLTDSQITSLLYKIGFRRDGFGELFTFLRSYCDGESLLDQRDVPQDVIHKDPATSPTPPGPHAPANSITVMAKSNCLELWDFFCHMRHMRIRPRMQPFKRHLI